ncbi:MAG TPA: hypothetical protein VF178_03935 [Gemmatimonadaceae bacterium]
MHEPRWARVEELFWAALDRPPTERRAFLDASCAGDDALQREVMSLLAADATTGSDPLRGSAADVLAQTFEAEAQAWIGRQVGPYRVIRRIGQAAWARCTWPSGTMSPSGWR